MLNDSLSAVELEELRQRHRKIKEKRLADRLFSGELASITLR